MRMSQASRFGCSEFIRNLLENLEQPGVSEITMILPHPVLPFGSPIDELFS